MTLEIIDYIKNNGVEKLENQFFIKTKRHNNYNNLVLFKYDQLESPMGSKVVQQARGIILDEDDNWNVVSYPYNKFFNYGEGHADEIDWDSARVYEKLDGSLMTMYFYDDQWHVASSGLPDASGNVMNTDITFAGLFWKVWHELGYELPPDNNACYMFELMTPYNRVVVKHLKNRIVLHGARRFSDFKELNPVVVAHQNNWECVKTYPLQSWEDVINASNELDPLDSEGFVVADTNYNRVKVKSPQYVALAHFRDSLSTRKILEAIAQKNETSEILSYADEYPEYAKVYYSVLSKYSRLLGTIEGMYEMVKDIDDKKQFALKVKDSKYSGALFALRNGKASSVKQYLANMNIKALEDMVGIKYVEL